jgi:hypothetical protein
MNPLEFQQWQYFILAVFGGMILVIILFFGHQSGWLQVGKKKPKHDEVHEFPEGIKEGHGRVPVFILIIFLAVLIWAVIYTIIIAVYGLKI